MNFDSIQPMLLDDRRYAAFSHPDWLYEVKYDGYRMRARFGDGVKSKAEMAFLSRAVSRLLRVTA